MPAPKPPEAKISPKGRPGASGLGSWLSVLGPGLVTGASDDDPSGIGTYAQTGAQFGYTQLWSCLFTLPLMTAIQEMCARIAMHTGEGLAQIIRKRFPAPILLVCVGLLLLANTVTVGADLGAMAAAARLLLPLPFGAWLVAMTATVTILLVAVSYKRYAGILRYLTLSLLAYVGVAFVAKQDWSQAFRHTVLPTVLGDKAFIANLVAILGTTISPYLFFWQAGQEVEEMIDDGKVTPESRRGVSGTELTRRRADVAVGMIFSNVVMWFIIVTAASTLHQSGIRQVDSAAQAAQALRPLAGRFASVLFTLGIVGTGLLAVPVLAGSSAYAISETFKMRHGLFLKLHQAPGFYGIIALSMLAGAAMNLCGINPMRALYYASMLNGFISPPLICIVLLIAGNRAIMGKRANGPLSNGLGWTTAALMAAAAVALAVTQL